MNLLEIRTKFVQESGRFDLVTDTSTWADNGANYYINNGIQMLGKLAQINSEKAKLYYTLNVGEYSLTFQHRCRVIYEIWVNTSETRYPLTKRTLHELKEFYADPALSTDNGQPGYFALAELRALETTDRDSLGVFINKTWDDSDTKYDYRGVIIVPPVDQTYVVEVVGLFKNVALSDDNDQNFWTIEEPNLLLRASLYLLESMNRGTENAKNWLSGIKDDIFELNKDVVEEEYYGINQIEN